MYFKLYWAMFPHDNVAAITCTRGDAVVLRVISTKHKGKRLGTLLYCN